MLFFSLLACASPTSLPVEAERIKGEPMVLSIYDNRLVPSDWMVQGQYYLIAWYGFVRSQEMVVSAASPDVIMEVVLYPDDLDTKKGGRPWVAFDRVRIQTDSVWPGSGCSSFRVLTSDNLEADLWEQPDHKGSCRAYLNGAQPTGWEAGYLIPVGQVVRPMPTQ